MQFIKNVFSSAIGFFIAICFFFIFLIVGVISIGGSQEVVVKDGSILLLGIDGELKDYAPKISVKKFDFEQQDGRGLNLIIKAIEKAKDDYKIKGISLQSFEGASFAQLSEIRQALEDFKSSGKFIYAFNQEMINTQADYYIQSLADTIALGVDTNLLIKGLGSNIMYFKDLQDKLGIHMEVVRHGKYKSAVEPHITNKMSEENRTQITELLQSIWQTYIEKISESRGISLDKLNEIAQNLGSRTSKMALDNKLIDAIWYRDQYEALLCKATKTEKVEDLNFISVNDYIDHLEDLSILEKKHENKIAVIYAEGVIMPGESKIGVIGDKTIIDALRQARKDKKVKAIVLRVNSPGGSANASERIHREIELTKEEKPIYISMSSLAASGGYYISCNASRIFADAQTVTGSIGIYAQLPNATEFIEKNGVNNEQVGTHPYASGFFNGFYVFEKMSEQTRKFITESIENGYHTFISRVAQGRNMTLEEVDAIAQGRVWTGKQAVELGLVDEIGSLSDVIKYVATENGMEEYSIENYQTIEISIEELFKNNIPFFSVKNIINQELGKQAVEAYEQVKENFKTERGLQAKMPYQLQIQ